MELSVKQNQVAKSETKNNVLVAQKYILVKLGTESFKTLTHKILNRLQI